MAALQQLKKPLLPHLSQKEPPDYLGNASWLNYLCFHDNSSKALGSVPPSVNLPSDFSSLVRVALIDPSTANLLAFYRDNGSKWTLFFNSSITTCENPTHCGSFALCNSSTQACSCPLGFVQNGRDCELETKNSVDVLSCPLSAETISYNFATFNVSIQPQLSAMPSHSVENCRLLCSQSCTCRAALYDPDTSSCSLFLMLRAVPVREDSKQLLFLKLAAQHKKHIRVRILLEALGAAFGVSLCLACAIAVLFCSRRKKLKSRPQSPVTEDVFLQGLPRLLPKYTFKELEAAMDSFSTTLGGGGFGAVYEGVLPSGAKVAVKKLENGGEQSLVQFRAEVASIGCISHMNLVTLKGFCYAKEGRLLVYEHMQMGSLDRWLFSKGEEEVNKLGWKQRFKIAMDTAKGLAYLHHDCRERIVHCDVKPENILLDGAIWCEGGRLWARKAGREGAPKLCHDRFERNPRLFGT